MQDIQVVMNGKLIFSVAKPIIRTIIEEDVFISNYYQKPLNFYICNYDENEKISEVAMDYFIEIIPTQINAPIFYNLYMVCSDGKEEYIETEYVDNKILTKSPITINCNEKITQKYKIDFIYDKDSNIELDEDFNITILVDSSQKGIE